MIDEATIERVKGIARRTTVTEPTEAQAELMPYTSERLWFFRSACGGDRAFYYMAGAYCCSASTHDGDCDHETPFDAFEVHGIAELTKFCPKDFFEPSKLRGF